MTTSKSAQLAGPSTDAVLRTHQSNASAHVAMLLLFNDRMWNVAGKAGGRGDPIMTGFDGRSFEILGQAGSIYSLISEKHHKVLTTLLLIKLS